jgi:undecaprenyl-diphosphatase
MGIVCFAISYLIGLLATANFRVVTAADHAISERVEASQPTEEYITWVLRVTRFGDYARLTPIVCIAMALFFFLRRWKVATVIALGFLVNPLLTDLAKTYFHRPRPGEFSLLSSYSYPSGHTTVATVFFLLLAWGLAGLFKRRALKIACLITCVLAPILVGISRICLDVHWLSDVYGGLLFGIAEVLGLIGLSELDVPIYRRNNK